MPCYSWLLTILWLLRILAIAGLLVLDAFQGFLAILLSLTFTEARKFRAQPLDLFLSSGLQ